MSAEGAVSCWGGSKNRKELRFFTPLMFFFSLNQQVLTFYFPDCGKLAPPVVQVQTMSFSYGEDKVSYHAIKVYCGHCNTTVC